MKRPVYVLDARRDLLGLVICSERLMPSVLAGRAVWSGIELRFLCRWAFLLWLVVAPAAVIAEQNDAAGVLEVTEEVHPVMPHHIVTDIVDTFTSRLKELHGKPSEVRTQMVGELVDRHLSAYLDIDAISRQIFGEHWKLLEEQQLTLQATGRVRQSFRKRYIKALSKYDRQRIRIFRTRIDPKDGDARVHVKVDARRKTLPVDVFFHEMENGEWRIYDIWVLGTSFVHAGNKTFQRGIKFYGLSRILNEIELEIED